MRARRASRLVTAVTVQVMLLSVVLGVANAHATECSARTVTVVTSQVAVQLFDWTTTPLDRLIVTVEWERSGGSSPTATGESDLYGHVQVIGCRPDVIGSDGQGGSLLPKF